MSQSHGHSTYVIFSVYMNGMPESFNKGSHKLAKEYMQQHAIEYKECIGVYQGMPEESFIVNAKHDAHIKQLATLYQQECVCVLHPHIHGMHKASFKYLDGRYEFMGYMRSVSEAEAKECVGYTYRPDLDKYWTITATDETRMDKLAA